MSSKAQSSSWDRPFKGTVLRDLLLLVFFHESVSAKPLSIPLGPFRIFSKILGDIRSSRLTTGINDTGANFAADINDTCHRCHWNRRQTMGLISGCRYLKVNLKAKMYKCVNSTIQRCPNKIIKIFLIEDFSHLPPVSTTPVVNLELRISLRIF